MILFFGLLRPYKGIDALLEAFAGSRAPSSGSRACRGCRSSRCESWRRGRRGRCASCPRFISDPEIPALMRRADVLALPYREIEQSGVLYTALAFGKPIVLSEVGGFSEVAERHGAARLVPPGDAGALARTLNELSRSRHSARASPHAAARRPPGPYSWDAIGRQTLALYDGFCADNPPMSPSRSLLGLGRPARPHPRHLSARALGARAAARGAPAPRNRPPSPRRSR